MENLFENEKQKNKEITQKMKKKVKNGLKIDKIPK